MQRVDLVDHDVDDRPAQPLVVDRVAGAGRADHHDLIAEAQLAVDDRAFLALVDRVALEAEGALEEVDRRVRVAVLEDRIDALHAPQATAPAAATTSFAAPIIPSRFGCAGAAALAGTSGSTQRISGGLQASCPMLARYQSISPAPLAAACAAIIAFSSFCFSRR